jgi:protein-L-isoaspartate(D-aspartate) O-methyltransferase
VWSIERVAALSSAAGRRLHGLGIDNVTLIVGDGAHGYTDAGPYDAIVVAAASPGIPRPLVAQLAVGGRLVIPVGDRALQDLTVLEHTPTGYRTTRAGACRFVPLGSEEAFGERW